jgi:DNA-binding response OmpR family regulator
MLRDAFSYILENAGFEVRTACDGLGALHEIQDFRPHLVVVSAALPQLCGLEVCRQVRNGSAGWHAAPLVITSTRHREADRLAAFECGADHYLMKPFGVREFLARVDALLRRAKISCHGTARDISVGRFHLHVAAQELHVHSSQRVQKIKIMGKQLALLRALMSGYGTPVMREQLLLRIWGCSSSDRDCGCSNTLAVHIRELRRKLEKDPDHPQHIVTLRGGGYMFRA